ncbi:MAG: sulfatase-like hydrolase/transferase [Pseudomonadota bacterium]|nr:sulfatase-like hydrolase/transferase [Pseudomonadota bacterium]
MPTRQPNILFLMADQMAAASLPFYGHRVVKTPNLSRLAEEGWSSTRPTAIARCAHRRASR